MGHTPINIGSRRELFVDDYLIDRLDGAALKLHEPHPTGVAVAYEEPWEDRLCFYTTVLRDGDLYRMYYRGRMAGSWTGYAESSDGIHWTKPRLGLVDFDGSTANNVILTNAVTFFPFLDTRAGGARPMSGSKPMRPSGADPTGGWSATRRRTGFAGESCGKSRSFPSPPRTPSIRRMSCSGQGWRKGMCSMRVTWRVGVERRCGPPRVTFESGPNPPS